MTDEELITALRKVDHRSVEDCFLQSPLFSRAADRIEALTAALPHMGGVSEWDGPYSSSAEALDATRRAVAEIIGADPATWPDHKNSPLAIASSFALASHEPAPEPAKDGPEVVERLRKWCSETINQWSDEYEPRENWERQVSGAMREWDKATTEIISDYEALRAEMDAEIKAVHEYADDVVMRCRKAESRNAELVKALEAIAALGGNLSDNAIETVGGINEGRSRGIIYASARQIAHSTLKGQSNEA